MLSATVLLALYPSLCRASAWSDYHNYGVGWLTSSSVTAAAARPEISASSIRRRSKAPSAPMVSLRTGARGRRVTRTRAPELVTRDVYAYAYVYTLHVDTYTGSRAAPPSRGRPAFCRATRRFSPRSGAGIGTVSNIDRSSQSRAWRRGLQALSLFEFEECTSRFRFLMSQRQCRSEKYCFDAV